MEYRRLVETFKLLSCEVRLKIVYELGRRGGPLSPSELAELVSAGASLVSYHLNKLREAGVVKLVAGGYVLTDHGRRLYEALRSVARGEEAAKVAIVLQEGWVGDLATALAKIEQELGRELASSTQAEIEEFVREHVGGLLETSLTVLASFIEATRGRASPRTLAAIYGLSSTNLRSRVELDANVYSFRQRRLGEIADMVLAQYAVARILKGELSDLVRDGVLAWRRPETVVKGALSLEVDLNHFKQPFHSLKLVEFAVKLSAFVGELKLWGIDTLLARRGARELVHIVGALDSAYGAPGRVELIVESPETLEVLSSIVGPQLEAVSLVVCARGGNATEYSSGVLNALMRGAPVTFISRHPPSIPVLALAQASVVAPALLRGQALAPEELIARGLDTMERVSQALAETEVRKSLWALLRAYLDVSPSIRRLVGFVGLEAALAQRGAKARIERVVLDAWQSLVSGFRGEAEVTVLHRGDEPYRALARLTRSGTHIGVRHFNSLSLFSFSTGIFDDLVRREAMLQERGVSTLPTLRVDPLPLSYETVSALLSRVTKHGLLEFALVRDSALCLSCGYVNAPRVVVCESCRAAVLARYVAPFGYLTPRRSVHALALREYDERVKVTPSWLERGRI